MGGQGLTPGLRPTRCLASIFNMESVTPRARGAQRSALPSSCYSLSQLLKRTCQVSASHTLYVMKNFFNNKKELDTMFNKTYSKGNLL